MRVHPAATAVLLVAFAMVSVNVSTAAAASYIATDHFTRNVQSGWGQTSPGGRYTTEGSATDFWVSTREYARGLGYVRVPRPGVARAMLLPQAQALNVELRFSVYVVAPPHTGPYYIYAVARRSGSSELRARIVYNADCTVSASGSVVASGKEQSLGTPQVVPGAQWCGGNPTSSTMTLRAQVTGGNPTKMRIKAWSAVPGVEPGEWLWSGRTDSAAVRGNGGVGLRVYASSGAANSPVQFRFYNWVAQSL